MSETNRSQRVIGARSGLSLATCTIFALVIGGSLLGAVRYDRTVPAVPIAGVPFTIRTPGVYRLAGDFHYGPLSGSAIKIESDNVIIDFAAHKLGVMAIRQPGR